MYPEKQASIRSMLKDFDVRIIVTGSRNYGDYDFFSKTLSAYVSTFGDQKISFISGAARTGADAMIIRWCKEYHFPCEKFPVQWDNLDIAGAVIRENASGKKYNALARHMRNAVMASNATHLLSFWDGISKGTANMIGLSKKLIKETILINKNQQYFWK